MSDKIARLGIERDNDLMYYIKSDGAVWATPRKRPGQPKGKPRKVADTGLDLDYSQYIYFLDGDGDVARKGRASGGGGRTKAPKATGSKPKKTPRSSISGHYVTEATAKRHPKTTVEETARPGRKKTVAQLEREIAECLAQKKGGNGNGNGGNGGNGAKNGNGNGAKNGNGGNGPKPAAKKKKARR